MQQSDLLLQAGPVAAASAKALVRRIAASGDAATIDNENAALIAALRVSPEGQEGLAAFLGKRRPLWTTES
jgi:methylglutaconyl-CoA hydratase